MAQSSFIDDLRLQPRVVCEEVPVLERLKYSNCVVQYFNTDLPAYLESVQTARVARLEAERDRVWDWLELLPKPNCENVPAPERDKFFFHCNTAPLSVDFLGTIQVRLESLKNDRDMMARRIDDLRRQYDTLVAQQGAAVPAVDAREIEALSAALQNLDATLVRVGLMEQLSDGLARQKTLPPISSLSFASIPADVELHADATGGAVLGLAGSGGKAVIKIQTTSQTDRDVIIIHPVLGLGYTSATALNAE